MARQSSQSAWQRIPATAEPLPCISGMTHGNEDVAGDDTAVRSLPSVDARQSRCRAFCALSVPGCRTAKPPFPVVGVTWVWTSRVSLYSLRSIKHVAGVNLGKIDDGVGSYKVMGAAGDQSPNVILFFLNKIQILNKTEFWTNFESEQNFDYEKKLDLNKFWICKKKMNLNKFGIWTKILNLNKIWFE
jgi:hypothetical protein